MNHVQLCHSFFFFPVEFQRIINRMATNAIVMGGLNMSDPDSSDVEFILQSSTWYMWRFLPFSADCMSPFERSLSYRK